MFDVTDARIRGPHDSLIIFKGMQKYNATNVKSLEDFQIAWVEEAQNFSQVSFDLLAPTIRAKDSELWFSWNPDDEEDAVDQFFRGEHKHPNAIVVEANWSDNPFFPEDLKQDMARDYEADPDKAAHVWGGQYSSVRDGAYYARLIVELRKDGRFAEIPYRKDLPVHVAWDIGIGDDTVLIFAQKVGGWLHIIDFHEMNSEPASYFVDIVQNKPYTIGKNYLPHDAESREWIAGNRRIDVLRNMGLKNLVVIPRIPVEDGIDAVRSLLPTMRFDKKRCHGLLKHLSKYRIKPKISGSKDAAKPKAPLHDEHSHAADAMRYLCLGLEPEAAPVSVQRYSKARRKQYSGVGANSSAWTA